jgi:hypothetical protein
MNATETSLTYSIIDPSVPPEFALHGCCLRTLDDARSQARQVMRDRGIATLRIVGHGAVSPASSGTQGDYRSDVLGDVVGGAKLFEETITA